MGISWNLPRDVAVLPETATEVNGFKMLNPRIGVVLARD
jgi:hypothetical protein